MYVEICPAVSTSGCSAATLNGSGDPECETFTAALRDPVKPVSPATKMTLKESTRTVTVQHEDTASDMTSGQELIIARHSDGYWFVIKWICDG